MFKYYYKTQIQSLANLNIIIVNTIEMNKSTYAKLIKVILYQ